MEFTTDVELVTGYDDNINRKEDKKKTESGFVSVIPRLELYEEFGSNLTTGVGYAFTYTQFLTEEDKTSFLHKGWGEITSRLRPRLFTNVIGSVEFLENPKSPDDNGWGLTFSPGLTYHVSQRMSGKVTGVYSRWKYDNLNFDSGRAVIRLDKHQVDNRYKGELEISYLLFLSTSVKAGYGFAYNESNNEINEYTVHGITASIQSALTRNLRFNIGYRYEKRDYSNWRAGHNLRGKLRDDDEHDFWTGLEYSAGRFLDLIMYYERIDNRSNISYESFERNLIYGGIRLRWDW